MTTERKRAGLNLGDFKPRDSTPDVAKEEVAKAAAQVAREDNFRTTNPTQTAAATPTPDRAVASAPTTAQAPAAAPEKSRPMQYARVAFDVPKALRIALQDGARKTGLGTVRAVILDALKAKGYPVSDDELLDKRTRR